MLKQDQEFNCGIFVGKSVNGKIVADQGYGAFGKIGFFEKYGELIFIVVLVFVIIPVTVFLVSRKAKRDLNVGQQPNLVGANN